MSYFKNSLYNNYLINLNYWFYNFFFIFILMNFLWKLNSFILKTFLTVFLIKYIFNFVLYNFYLRKKLLTTLMVGTISIHPFLFYFVLIVVIFFFFSKQIKFFTQFLFNLNHILFWAVLSLLLGGLWGLQSLTWGYIWVNDSIEWIFLFFIILIIMTLHTFHKKILFLINFYFNLYLNYVLILRLNLITTRHSFLSNTAVYLYVITLFYTILLVLSKSLSCRFFSFKINIFFFFYWISFLAVSYFFVYSILFKYIFILLFFFFLFNLSKKLFYLHFIFFCLFFLWLSWYVYFFLFFNKYYIIGFNNFDIGENMLKSNQLIFSNILNSELLEKLFFIIFNNQFYNTSLISWSTVLIFNNLLFIYLTFILIFFLKKVEFRLLYTKKAYF